VLGDSLSAEYGIGRGKGWVSLLQARLDQRSPSLSVVNASVSGETTAGGRTRIAALLERHKPGLVVIELGGNDALRGLDLKRTEANLREMIAVSRAAGARTLLVGMQVPPNYGRAYTQAFEDLFVEVARSTGTPLVPFLLAGIAEDLSFFQDDQIHPNERAQPLMLETVWPTLKPLLP
jgi:acyl-CoA thioesterase-1